jgi:hypothetical protein
MENEGLKMPRTGLGKLRCDSTWAALTPEQRETLEGWLFEENLGYKEVLERAQKEFGVTGSKMSLTRHYRRVATERAQRDFLDLEATIKDLNGTKLNWSSLGGAAMGIIAKQLVRMSLESPEKVQEMAMLGQVLVANDAQNIKRGWLEMGRIKFQMDMATECLIHKREIDEIDKDESLTDAQRILKIRDELFGPFLAE